MCVAAKDYCGTSKFASDAVLEALAQDRPVTVEPADDLQSLVGVRLEAGLVPGKSCAWFVKRVKLTFAVLKKGWLQCFCSLVQTRRSSSGFPLMCSSCCTRVPLAGQELLLPHARTHANR